ncbi:MAG: xanthine dehydrogenase family protein molybdopterin-binding subunit [Proteobacteria bacterium]|jgi:aerobic carbon-monoxide dehydrogenase large subunit|nr:xanthine dehydrogenase family protein molybdopterin-binding subunit [Pseudomonadota bacterium]MBT6465633.1 xanthine dehydrogenase family protein molybdopterin-binding subunit [Pseudomonadota bacterium]MBT6673797.1 xanthine dehydrogenase family protein molybdopterin-binding subunit [Pseudomonadota bacterium]MBT7626568.1 xanthine dehydrogenase family protein molybdopterin-binding subunit [Pseudomonadota bacterium]
MSQRKNDDWMGTPLPRKEDRRLLTGKGKYVSDIVIPGALHAVFVRSEYAHAKILSIDTSEAEELAGVERIYTGDQIKHLIKSMPQPIVQPALPAHYPTFWPLAVDKVTFHGEPVALVIARDKYVAEDAAELVFVDYEELEPVLDPEEALKPESAIIHEKDGTNEIFSMTFTGGDTEASQAKNAAEVEKIFQNAPIVVKDRFKTHRTGVTPMEPRAILCDWDDSDGLLAYITTQRPHIDRLALSDILDISAEKVQVIAPRDQGGGFGVKAPFYRENIIIAHAARDLKQPVRWVESRYESLMNVGQERDQINDMEIAADLEGNMLALRNFGLADNGVGTTGVYWGFVMPFLGAIELPNGYKWPKADIRLKVATTNKACLTPSRAFGHFPTRFAIERCIDMVAHKIGMEPSAFRRKNLVADLPYTSITNEYFDSGDFLKVWDTLMEKANLPDFRVQQKNALSEGKYIGIGFGCGVELSGVASELFVPMENQPGYGAATVRLDPRGKVQVFGGDAPGGQGHETTTAQVVASEFGISPEDVIITTGNTGSTPFGSGSVGARMGSYFISAVAEACRELKTKIAKFLAHDLQLEASVEHFEFKNGEVVYLGDDSQRSSFMSIVERIIMFPINMPEGETGGLDATTFFEAAKPMICFNADCCVVEVSLETGDFKILKWITAEDVGNVINPLIVNGQMHGAIVQGISNTVFEEFVYDEQGQQLTADFEHYKMANAADVPNIDLNYATTPCPHTPLGTRGIGEGRPSSVPGALTNAVCDALKPFEIEITTLPLRPDAIWQKIQDATQ